MMLMNAMLHPLRLVSLKDTIKKLDCFDLTFDVGDFLAGESEMLIEFFVSPKAGIIFEVRHPHEAISANTLCQ